MVRFFLAVNGSLVALFAAANNIERDVENLDVHLLYFVSHEMETALQIDRRINGRLGMDLGIVFLDNRLANPVQAFSRPVDFESAGDTLHESLVAFKDFQRAGNAPHRQKRGM